MKRFAVFVTGNGSNLQAIIEAVKERKIKAEIALVFSNKSRAYALQRAKAAGIKTLYLNPKRYTNKQSFERDVVIELKKEGVDFIVLAGYMLMLSPYFMKEYPDAILNVHPSLLPSFKGKQGMKDAYTYGAKVSGVTIHFVDEMMDHGPIIMQEAIKLAEGESFDSLEDKIHKIEHRLYPKAIEMFVDGRLKIKNRKVKIV